MKLSTAISDFLEHLAVEKNRSPRTITLYQHYFNRFAGWLKKDVEIEDISLDQVRKFRLFLHNFLDERNDPLELRTQSYHVVALRSLFRYARKRGLVTLSADQLELPKLDPREVSFMTADELEVLLTTPDETTMTGLRDRAIMELFFSTGLRVSELAATGEMRVVGKGRKERIVFISPRAAQWYQAYIDRRGDSLSSAFVGYRGKGVGDQPSPKVESQATTLTPRSIERAIEKHAVVAGLVKKVTPHTLRHSFATDLLLNGADIRSVQTLLGHASITTTQIYTHITNSQLHEVHSKFHGKQLHEGSPDTELAPPEGGASDLLILEED
jgi:site-specific recombinase XerD